MPDLHSQLEAAEEGVGKEGAAAEGVVRPDETVLLPQDQPCLVALPDLASEEEPAFLDAALWPYGPYGGGWFETEQTFAVFVVV